MPTASLPNHGDNVTAQFPGYCLQIFNIGGAVPCTGEEKAPAPILLAEASSDKLLNSDSDIHIL